MIRVILNRLKSKAEGLLAEEKAEFRAGRRVEQSSCRNTCNASCSTTLLEKAYDRVWYNCPRHFTRRFNIDEELVQVIQ
ncbi:hypothetical protein DPMN_038139 [Dreissena polymorpha]|uniref:Uncharacterized protein n=1 Tax=Dreissena polymorpha TaxID=45954 RepID=A0A9D4MFS4_DREPO|nr:hypothetical protein DPMN_038139 [Dreissena polymorpha]